MCMRELTDNTHDYVRKEKCLLVKKKKKKKHRTIHNIKWYIILYIRAFSYQSLSQRWAFLYVEKLIRRLFDKFLDSYINKSHTIMNFFYISEYSMCYIWFYMENFNSICQFICTVAVIKIWCVVCFCKNGKNKKLSMNTYIFKKGFSGTEIYAECICKMYVLEKSFTQQFLIDKYLTMNKK